VNKYYNNDDGIIQKQELFSLPFICTFLLCLVGLYFAFYKPFVGLDAMGHQVMGTIIGALAFWMFKPGGIPFAVGTVVLLVGCVMSGLSISQVAAGFSGSSLWLLIPALFFGFALKKSGLGNRIAFFLLKSINPSYIGILLVWLVLGTGFSLLTPSIGIRFLILTAISMSVADACNLSKDSRGRSLIIITAWASAIFPGTGWYTGSLYGPVLTGFLPIEMQRIATEGLWFKVMGLPWIFITIAFFVIIYFMLRPEEKLHITQEKFAALYLELGNITKSEKIVFITLMTVLLCLPFQAMLGLASFQIMLLGFLIFLLTRVIGKQDIGTGISWDIILFFGIIMGLPDIIITSGIASWAEPVMGYVITFLTRSALTFLIGLTLIFFALRFIDVTWGFAIGAFLATATPVLYNSYHIHPTIVMMIFTFGGTLFFTSYQQPWIPQAESIMQDAGWNPKHLRQAACVYAGVVILTLIIFLPYWNAIGVMSLWING
jgi:di/tricarboxylate transporter